ncbi:unnamed protein product [Cuscuta campestris]|uniref:Thaumatin-like protein 1 n=1 Tax=Cuscuta campestris TaxID=132261 RepID=A0A484M099_9ASTE|nr:unnamed protein product [Cuscuta campestris]
MYPNSPPFTSYLLFFIPIFVSIPTKGVIGATFVVINRCDYTVWPGILGNAGSAGLGSTGFRLPPGGSRAFQVSSSWSGRIWGRTGCTFDPVTGQGSCATADCGSNQMECNGAGATPPATLAEFTVGGPAGTPDFYDVSLVDGFNLPMQVEPVGGAGACGSTGCAADVNRMCPEVLRAGDGQACRSACGAFGSPEYCCSGAYGSPSTCRPSEYSEMFKTACPRSYSYAYDDATSTFTCLGADYRITFCPSQTRQMQRSSSTPASALPSSQVAGTSSSSSGPPAATQTTRGFINSVSGPPEGIFKNPWMRGIIPGDSPAKMSHFALHYSKSPMMSALAMILALSFIHLACLQIVIN